jgi:hypothetical protein
MPAPPRLALVVGWEKMGRWVAEPMDGGGDNMLLFVFIISNDGFN